MKKQEIEAKAWELSQMVGKQVECYAFGSRVTGRMARFADIPYVVQVDVVLDTPIVWGNETFEKMFYFMRKSDGFGPAASITLAKVFE